MKSLTGCAGSGLLSSGMTEPVMWWLIVPSGWITNRILHENSQEPVLSATKQSPSSRTTSAPLPPALACVLLHTASTPMTALLLVVVNQASVLVFACLWAVLIVIGWLSRRRRKPNGHTVVRPRVTFLHTGPAEIVPMEPPRPGELART